MQNSLLIDFGATRVKSACWNGETLLDIQSRPSVAPVQKAPFFEIPLQPLLNSFTEICQYYANKYSISKILICSQMHGFALMDKHQHFLTPYISWQDERSLLPVKGKTCSWDLFKEAFSGSFQSITGMRIRAGFPVIKIFDFLRTHPTDAVKIVSLPEILCTLGNDLHKVHITMAAGSGCINFETQKTDPTIQSFIKQHTGTEILFNEIVKEIVPCAEFLTNGKSIPIYTAVGDHQCAVLGAGNTTSTWSINLGTGSQVSSICSNAPSTISTERRHFFNNFHIQTITHIPAGRVLAGLIAFYENLTHKNGWDMFNQITTEQMNHSNLPNFNLAFFPDAYGYTKGGEITGLSLENCTESALFAGLVRSFAQQYITAFSHFDKTGKTKLIVSGGKLAKHKGIVQFLQQHLSMPAVIANQGDETLLGLIKLIPDLN